ncbi:MAG TPA: phospho-N-acetylmuramoyl-pentapeptide-transferase [Candidatus Merdicola faecigallinarum]|uniref:Phospho-N-acetylmuramoyl-pentapeptide-transferase n=1 Tax=Candidatus Merdicola faecigallinarum TaxID=2840862 RepID=A0A9D1M084_9FIRM|nr:phospho-N-acetylmuramoyl-pentapeptide-transferase [Candidatus Merdicola faecigallinarum]
MDFQITVLCLTFIVTIIIALIIIPILRKLKVGQIERSDGPQSHLKKQGTPTMGGTIMIVSITLITLGIAYYFYRQGDMETAKKLLPLLIASVGFGIVGFVDDFKKLVLKNTIGLKPAYKMLGLLIISVLYTVYLVQVLDLGTETLIPFAKTYITLPIWVYIPFAIFVMLGTTNAVNLTDGVDGLSTSVTTIIITCLTVIGMILGIKEIMIFGCIVCGSNLAFLLFNLHPAKVMMGDTGSLLLGGVIASISLYLRMPLLLLIIALVPVLETVSVIIQVAYFKRTGNRIFKMAPLHHHFELSGWNENKVVSIFSIITLVFCVIGINII